MIVALHAMVEFVVFTDSIKSRIDDIISLNENGSETSSRNVRFVLEDFSIYPVRSMNNCYQSWLKNRSRNRILKHPVCTIQTKENYGQDCILSRAN